MLRFSTKRRPSLALIRKKTMAQLCIDIRLVFLSLCRGYWLFRVSHTKQHLSVAYHKDALGNTRGPGDNDDPELTRAFHSGAHAAAGMKALSRGGPPEEGWMQRPRVPVSRSRQEKGMHRECTTAEGPQFEPTATIEPCSSLYAQGIVTISLPAQGIVAITPSSCSAWVICDQTGRC